MRIGGVEKLSFFELAILKFFQKKEKKIASFLFKVITNQWVPRNQGWDEILMIILIFSKKIGVYKIMRNTVSKNKIENEFNPRPQVPNTPLNSFKVWPRFGPGLAQVWHRFGPGLAQV